MRQYEEMEVVKRAYSSFHRDPYDDRKTYSQAIRPEFLPIEPRELNDETKEEVLIINSDEMGSCNDFSQHGYDMGNNNTDPWGNDSIKNLYEKDGNVERQLFLDDYFNYMKKKGYNINKVPIVGKKPLDLYELYKAVQNHGGFEQVSQKRKWSKVVRELHLPQSITSAAYTLRTQFEKLLYRFECFKKGVQINKKYLDEEQKNFDSNKKYDWRNDLILNGSFPNQDNHVEETAYIQARLQRDYQKSVDRSASLPSPPVIPTGRPIKEENADESRVYVKRAKSEEIYYRRNSSENVHKTLPRSESFDGIFQNRRKRKYSLTEDLDEVEQNNNFIKPKKTVIESHEEIDQSLVQNSHSLNEEIYNSGIENTNNYSLDARKHKTQEGRTLDYENEYYPNERRQERQLMYRNVSPSVGLSNYPTYSKMHRDDIQSDCPCDECKQKKRRFFMKRPHTSLSLQENDTSLPVKRYSIQYRVNHGEYEPPMTFPTPPPSQSKDAQSAPFRYNRYEERHNGRENRQRLPTNPGEMTLRIKERTKNAVVLSIVVDGICYSGTLSNKNKSF